MNPELSSEPPPPTFRRTLIVRERNRWVLGGSAAIVVAGIVIGLAASGPLLPMALMVAAFAPLLFSVVVRKNLASVPVHREIVASLDGLQVGRLCVPRAAIKDAQVVPVPELMVRVARRHGLPLELPVLSTAEGRELLRALGFDVSQTVLRFRASARIMSHWAFRSGAAIFGAVALASMEMAHFHASFSIVLVFALALVMIIPSRIHVGADGVLVTWMGTRRFFAITEILGVEKYVRGAGRNKMCGARLTLADGARVDLPVGQARWADDRAEALVERIREARETGGREVSEAAAVFLERGARGVAEWIQALRAVGAGAIADLRSAPMNHERLWRVVESHGAPAEERAAAAVALASSLDAPGKERLRVAAEAVADRRLRVVLDAAESGDEAAMAEALQEVAPAPRAAAT
ncbi:MAG TPA: hypothetical protein VGI39_05755 [Polyangiaceae bacterium]|jgi:hypothetical protein